MLDKFALRVGCLLPTIEVRERFSGAAVVAALEQVCAEVGYPRSIRVDPRPELASKDLDM